MTQAMALVLVGVIFGGGGGGAGLYNLLVQLAAIALIAVNASAFVDFLRRSPRYFVVLVVATLLLPLLQIVPLPPSIWRALPGREMVEQSLTLIGRQDEWFPFSLDMRRTAVAFLAMLPPLAVLILARESSAQHRRQFLVLIAMAGALSVLIGLPQLATGNRMFVFFAEAYGSQDLQGTFANHNTAALFLDIALVALICAMPEVRMRPSLVLSAGGCGLLLLIGLFLTRSRSGMLIGVVPFVCLLVRIYFVMAHGVGRKRFGMAMLLSCLGLGCVVWGGAQVDRVQQSFARFENLNDERPAIWSDTRSAIRRYWPVGSGVGTFDEVFQVDESLENLAPHRAGRAHNDYLELTLESGVFGIALLIGWLAVIVLAMLRAVSSRGIIDLAPGAVFVMLFMQSVLDYPLRSQAILCVAGLMLAMIIRPVNSGPTTVRSGRRTEAVGSL
ncbi:O-antigen ligase family protein [Sphingomonas sp. IC081]|uniref:O-antigen ligase family protein n=1 Tax=Sphingomonas sp. IC081 TaxID=304378 RepID=UPI00115B6A82|nr:O-antigen ligase family protein [Sphingomonas sp. IC081]QDK31501.1 hypothetical protein DM450_01515 [Sphingomonas sp. IC081]